MASFTFNNTLQQQQQKHHFFCKYPKTITSKPYFCISHVSKYSTLKEQVSLVFTTRTLICNSVNAQMCGKLHKYPARTLISFKDRDFGGGVYPLRSRDVRVRRGAKVFSSVVEERTERKDVESSGREREMKGLFSSLRSRDERGERESKRSKIRVDGDKERSNKGNKSKGDIQGEEEKKGKMSIKGSKSKGDIQGVEEKTGKKSKSPIEIQLRIDLDMCSKRGDVLGAISLYDLAQREGIPFGQYHYTVLLYLCSSAAAGVLQPAKSGSGRRSFAGREMSYEISTGNLTKFHDMGDKGYGRENNVPASSNKTESKYGGLLVNSVISTSKPRNQLTNSPSGLEKERLRNNLNHKKTSGEGKNVSAEEDCIVDVKENIKNYALKRGFEAYENMRSEKIPLNEAAFTSIGRMAMSMGDGNMAFEMVTKMKKSGINPRLRSYGPALFTFCNNGDIENAFKVEEHMLENGIDPEEPELEALLRLSVEAGRGEKVYYVLHKLRTSVRQVSGPTADSIEIWFQSKGALKFGKIKWDENLIMDAMDKGGGGWHGLGWLGKGKWKGARTLVGTDGVCECCGEKLATIDLDPIETDNFAKSVASIAAKREKHSSFQKFQKWLDYYGPFEAVVDGANVGLFSQRGFLPSKVNSIVNGIRQKLPSKKRPLIVVHHKRVTGGKMDEPANKMLIEKWKNADALYVTPTGSNDDWYWLYAAIKNKCLIVTNDEMRDHLFHLLGNDFFPKWKERHQVHFSFGESGPEFRMPPPYSVVIQESMKGHWHIPIASENDIERERTWLCATRTGSQRQDSPERANGVGSLDAQTKIQVKLSPSPHTSGRKLPKSAQDPQAVHSNLRNILSTSVHSNGRMILDEIEAAEILGDCIIDFEI
ncbi:hypothetical protein GIB67_017298 [Kingdonia uniflora]|uniref:ribonuclease P n=1 Tax=Kingdonia uniflora TaxID=39325 RepID=A0A7J7N3Q2_9MAGN|nr:hypothetical protein GIB67_017298 [Kingdonia uniflora]